MEFTEVTVINSSHGYTVKVAVYRHVTTPNEITVHIESIHPLPPVAPEDPKDPVCKLVEPGKDQTFLVDSTYPGDAIITRRNR